jgi:hypothetical protein
MTLPVLLMLIALILFAVEAVRSKSLLAAGLAFAAGAQLAGMGVFA